ncbi:PREDICTED: uncharacterized protein LOC109235636 isoform X1 [Nicotiana attenuata]|uniref:HMA domain-containing protein n=1 Tax=Nicotiana attenuata TaxID=49451 RepID=A0A1J6HTW9_NICAT|nr:PREDICTED: uncharacterized protein LOC109235636 isoform X1 [Nicotiana attenuata]OIS96324.1 hypothetical protein A4A49_08141 [Nicotiana attenuata]
MALVSWAKKELSRLKLQKPKRLTLETSTSTKCMAYPLVWSNFAHRRITLYAGMEVKEVVLEADLRCANCQNRVSTVISNIEDVESIVVHVQEKKVTLIRKSASK